MQHVQCHELLNLWFVIMETEEIAIDELEPERFIAEQMEEISSTVGNGSAINALSGGGDSSVVTMIG